MFWKLRKMLKFLTCKFGKCVRFLDIMNVLEAKKDAEVFGITYIEI